MKQLNIKNLDDETFLRFNRAKTIRGISQAEYLRRLVELHRNLLIEIPALRIERGSDVSKSFLREVGLEPVREGG